jgi:hypothetical protein
VTEALAPSEQYCLWDGPAHVRRGSRLFRTSPHPLNVMLPSGRSRSSGPAWLTTTVPSPRPVAKATVAIRRQRRKSRTLRLAPGHGIAPRAISIGSIACSCGRHLTWRCECGAVTYGPALGDGCSLLDGPARVR